MAGTAPAATADSAESVDSHENYRPVSQTAELIEQAQARTDSATARGASALLAVASIHTNEPGTAPNGPADTATPRGTTAEDIQSRPSLTAAGQATVTAARAATAALENLEQLPNPPKNVQLTAASAKGAADKAAADPSNIELANRAATAENKALAASAAVFGTTATKVKWIIVG